MSTVTSERLTEVQDEALEAISTAIADQKPLDAEVYARTWAQLVAMERN